MSAGDVEGALADLRRRLDDLAAQTALGQSAAAAGTARQLESLRGRIGRLEALPGELERVAEAATVGREATVATLRGVIEQLARTTESLQQATLETLRAEMERMAAAVGERLAALESLPGDVQGLHRELDRVVELATGRHADVDRLVRRTGPLEEAVAALGADLERARAETAAASRSATAAAAERMDGLAARLADVEPVHLDIESLRHDLERVVEEVSVARQAALSAAGEQLSAQARLRSLETLPDTVESLRRDVAGLSQQSAATSERLASVEARLAALESLPADVQGVYRELDRVAELTSGRAAELAQVVGPAGTLQTEIDELRGEIARVSGDAASRDRVDSLSSRLEGLEAVRAHVAELTHQVGRIAARTTPIEGAVDGLRRRLDAVARESAERVRPLEALPAQVERLSGALHGVAEQVRDAARTALSAAAQRAAPVEAAVEALRVELERVAADVVAVQRSQRAPAAFHLKALEKQVAALERRLAGQAATAEDGVAGAGPQLAELAAKVRALEGLPADIEGVYAALYRVAEEVKAARRDAALA